MNSLLLYLFSYSKNWTEKDKKYWKEMRCKGAVRFILVEGVLKWGALSLTIFLFATYNSLLLQAENQAIYILVAVIVWFIGAILYGFLNWKYSNISFEKNLVGDSSPFSGSYPKNKNNQGN